MSGDATHLSFWARDLRWEQWGFGQPRSVAEIPHMAPEQLGQKWRLEFAAIEKAGSN